MHWDSRGISSFGIAHEYQPTRPDLHAVLTSVVSGFPLLDWPVASLLDTAGLVRLGSRRGAEAGESPRNIDGLYLFDSRNRLVRRHKLAHSTFHTKETSWKLCLTHHR